MRQELNVNADGVRLALDATNGAPQATLRLVLDMLLPNEAGKQAAAAIEECVLVSGVVFLFWVGGNGAVACRVVEAGCCSSQECGLVNRRMCAWDLSRGQIKMTG
jgi:hypothetical protein